MLHATYTDAPEPWRWPHFTARELACRCDGRFCRGEYWHDPAFLDALEDVRAATGRPMRINSARRCPRHNAAVGGVRASRHSTSLAVDVDAADLDDDARRTLLAAARRFGFTGVGYARGFLHLDRRPRPASWDYRDRGRSFWPGA